MKKTLSAVVFKLILFLFVVISLVSCSYNSEEKKDQSDALSIEKEAPCVLADDIRFNSENVCVLGTADSSGLYYYVCDSGMLYISNNRMQYYDFEKELAFPLCSDVNCTHNSTECPSYVQHNDILGLCMIDNRVYYVTSGVFGKIELVSMAPTGNEKRIVFSMDTMPHKLGDWNITCVNNVCYSQNIAWLSLSWEYRQDQNNKTKFDYAVGATLLAVDIESGRIVASFEDFTPSDDIIRYSLVFLSPEYAIIKKSYGFPQNDYYRNFNTQFDIHIYDFDSGETSLFAHENYDEDVLFTPNLNCYNPIYAFNGIYDGQLIYMKYSYEDMFNQKHYLYDFDSGESVLLYEFNCGCNVITSGNVNLDVSTLHDSRKVLYGIYPTEGDYSLFNEYIYDLDTGETTLIEDGNFSNIYTIIGETRESYVCTNQQDIINNSGRIVYVIEKSDFENGKFDCIRSIIL